MTYINRRQWLKSASIAAGAFTILQDRHLALDRYASVLGFNEDLYTNDGLIKLSSNENPFGPSAKVRTSITSAFDRACRYPTSEIKALTQKIALKEGVSEDHVLITVGSTEGLKIAALAYLKDGGELVSADPTFEAMPNYAEACGAYVHRVPVDSNLGLDLLAMEKRCNSNTNLVFICNPNNPTGTLLPANEMLHFCTKMASKTMVFSDEAYFDYITTVDYPSMVTLVKKDLNVIVAKTFSKVYGLAGLRIGYLVARPDIIQRLDTFQIDRPNILAIAAASTAMDEQDFYQFSINVNKEAKQTITKTLDQLNMQYTDSHTNFIFFKSGRYITTLIQQMKTHNLMIGRPFKPYTDWCRISTGKKEEMEVFTKALVKVFS
jgi:histidinol-phosphate aminotransferase